MEIDVEEDKSAVEEEKQDNLEMKDVPQSEKEEGKEDNDTLKFTEIKTEIVEPKDDELQPTVAYNSTDGQAEKTEATTTANTQGLSLIHEADPQSHSVVITIFILVVCVSVRLLFFKSYKTNQLSSGNRDR